MAKRSISYASTGVRYDAMDPIKVLAQLRAKSTSSELQRFGMQEVGASRGESAYVWEEKDSYRAFVVEGLGTKNLVADDFSRVSKRSHYDSLAQDTVAMIVNDLIVVGADPQIVNAYFAVGSSDWFEDEQRSRDLVEGWAKACRLAGATWGGGETPTLKGVINPAAIDLGGAAVGIIKPKSHLVLGDKLTSGDLILLIESSGIHANGLTLARAIADKLPKGYATKLSDGNQYGEALLAPTHIYAQLVRRLFTAKLNLHYMVNVTGHGWRKLMRANQQFSYIISDLPEISPLFEFIQRQSGNDNQEMYGNFNMGAGFAVYLPEKDAIKAQEIAGQLGFKSWLAGRVARGPKQVVIEPKNITFKGETLGVR